MAKPLAKLATFGVGLALATAACVVNSTDVPSLTGPSEMGLSFGLTASPDTITQDGASQSRIVLSAFDPSGKPAVGVSFRLDMIVDGSFAEFGTLSARTLLTGSDGKATAVRSGRNASSKAGASAAASAQASSARATPTSSHGGGKLRAKSRAAASPRESGARRVRLPWRRKKSAPSGALPGDAKPPSPCHGVPKTRTERRPGRSTRRSSESRRAPFA